MSAGKGSVRRPRLVDDRTFTDRWDAVFGSQRRCAACKHCTCREHDAASDTEQTGAKQS